MGPFPLYKGATRAAVTMGVPLIPLIVMVMVVAVVALIAGFWWWGLLLPGWVLMRQITKSDDRAFRIVWLWARTRLLNRARMARAGGAGFWGASSYALSDERERSWKAEDMRWGG